MTRPLMQQGIAQLEALYSTAATDVKSLKQLQHELQFRQVPRAVVLLEKVEKALAGSRVAPTAPPQFSGSNAAPATVPLAGLVASVEQADLWGTASADRAIVAPRVVTPPPAVRPAPAATAMPPQNASQSPSVSTLSVDEAYKVLKATPSSTWQSIEQTRRQLVQLAASGKQVGGRALSYLSVPRGRPPAFYGSGHSTT